MAAKKEKVTLIRPTEGAFYAVPLDDGKYGLCLLTRFRKDGLALGYFFGPRQKTIDDIRTLAQSIRFPDQAVHISKFAIDGIQYGEWPFVGNYAIWNPNDWAVPLFQQREGIIPGEAPFPKVKVIEWDDDVSAVISEKWVKREAASDLPFDSVSGHIALQRTLSKKIDAENRM